MKTLLIFLFSLVMIDQLNAQDISGGWAGVLPAGGVSLHLIFNIKKTADTSYTATMDSPDQKVFGIPCTKTSMLKDSLFISVKNIT